MAHFAEIQKNIVVRVLVTDNDAPNEGLDWLIENFGGTWVQTSYNANFRKNFAGVGFTYDVERDAFIAPQPFSSWILNEKTCCCEDPMTYPQDGLMYEWDEVQGDWSPIVFEGSES